MIDCKCPVYIVAKIISANYQIKSSSLLRKNSFFQCSPTATTTFGRNNYDNDNDKDNNQSNDDNSSYEKNKFQSRWTGRLISYTNNNNYSIKLVGREWITAMNNQII